jgi:hypothetical protein
MFSSMTPLGIVILQNQKQNLVKTKEEKPEEK